MARSSKNIRLADECPSVVGADAKKVVLTDEWLKKFVVLAIAPPSTDLEKCRYLPRAVANGSSAMSSTAVASRV